MKHLNKITLIKKFPEGGDTIFKSVNFIAFLYTNILFALKERGIFFCISCLTAQFSAYDFRQPLISGEARASPVSPIPTLLG